MISVPYKIKKMKSPNQYHIESNGPGIYYLDSLNLLWHESIYNDRLSRQRLSLLHIKFIAKIKITFKKSV